jgi:hypothetical protein
MKPRRPQRSLRTFANDLGVLRVLPGSFFYVSGSFLDPAPSDDEDGTAEAAENAEK